MRQRGIHIVDEDQAQVAWFEARQSGVDGQEFTADFLDRRGSAGFFQALLQ